MLVPNGHMTHNNFIMIKKTTSRRRFDVIMTLFSRRMPTVLSHSMLSQGTLLAIEKLLLGDALPPARSPQKMAFWEPTCIFVYVAKMLTLWQPRFSN